MTDWKQVGRRVARLRDDVAMTQDALAVELGYSRSLLGELERGTEHAGLAFIIAIADYFKVPLDWLLGRSVPPGGPLAGQFIDQPNELALIALWRDQIHALKDKTRS